MAGLKAQVETTPGSGTWVDSGIRAENSVGTPLVSAAENFSGEALAGVYVVNFSGVVPNSGAIAIVTANRTSNPYDQREVAVVLDGTTANKSVIGGIDLILSPSLSFSDSWEVVISIGVDYGVLGVFPPVAGVPTDSIKVRIVNTGALAAESCRVLLTTMVKRYLTTPGEGVFARIRPFADDAVESLSSGMILPYNVVAENVSGSGDGKIVGVRFAGDLVNVINLTDSIESDSAALSVQNFYRVMSGDFSGLEFRPGDTEDGWEENLLVFSPRLVQIAEDLGGAPGLFGNSPVNLTSDGQEVGIIGASQFGIYYQRLLVPAGSITRSNPYPCDVCLEGTVAEAAGWES